MSKSLQAFFRMMAMHGQLAAVAVSASMQPAAAIELPRVEIYLLMGQSNMVGRDTSDLPGQAEDARIVTLDSTGTWVVARDPIHAKTGSTDPGVGPGIGFAREMLVENPALTIGLVPTAVGGTALRRWVKGGDLYEQAVARARVAAQSGVIRGVLWHQGESDAKSHRDASNYGARLTQMFKDLRQDLGQPELPIIVGQIGEFLSPARFPAADTVADALRRMPEALRHVGFADSAGLAHKGDHLHFNSAAAREMGRRYAHAMLELQANQTGSAGAEQGH